MEASIQGFMQGSSMDKRVMDASQGDKVTAHGSILLGTNANLNLSKSVQISGWIGKYPYP